MSLRKRNGATGRVKVANQQSQLTKFTKYGQLVPLLRDHILSYLKKKKNTLRNYAQCSMYCNSEVQKFNTTAPDLLELDGQDDGVSVKLVYYGRKNKKRSITKHFGFSDSLEQNIQQYLLKCYKYVKTESTGRVNINMRKWSNELMNMSIMTETNCWNVVLYKSMMDGFMEYFKTTDMKIQRLYLDPCKSEVDGVRIPSEFFNYNSVKQLIELNMEAPASMDSIEFANLECPTIGLVCELDVDAIHRKIEKINADKPAKYQSIEFDVPRSSITSFRALFSNHRFSNEVIYERERCRIGKVKLELEAYIPGRCFLTLTTTRP